jgi:hypothetical protein
LVGREELRVVVPALGIGVRPHVRVHWREVHIQRP